MVSRIRKVAWAALALIGAVGCDTMYNAQVAQEEIAAKYRLAWSIAYFLEVGAPQMRFRPFENLRADYLKALVRTHSMREATAEVLDGEAREEFVAAWLDFWKRQ